MTCPMCERSLVPIATTSPVDTLRGRVPPRCDGLSADQLDDAVGRDQPVGDCEPVSHDPADRLHAGRSRTSPAAHFSSSLVVLVGDAAVDRAPDARPASRPALAHPDDAEEHAAEEGAPLALRHPPEEPPRRACEPAVPGWSRGSWRARANATDARPPLDAPGFRGDGASPSVCPAAASYDRRRGRAGTGGQTTSRTGERSTPSAAAATTAHGAVDHHVDDQQHHPGDQQGEGDQAGTDQPVGRDDEPLLDVLARQPPMHRHGCDHERWSVRPGVPARGTGLVGSRPAS